MAAITAAMVGELRAKTDAPMMECKKALNEAEGDHYEEVYALSPEVERHAIHPILQLLKYRK